MEETFYYAAFHGRVEKVKDILRKDPSLNVNWKNEEENARTALFAACWNGHDLVVSILLAHPGIDPNLKKYAWNHSLLDGLCQWKNVVCPSAAAGSSGHGC